MANVKVVLSAKSMHTAELARVSTSTVFLFSFTGRLQGLRIIPTLICLPAKGNLRMFLQVWPYSCLHCALVTLSFIFASLYKLVADAGLGGLLHGVIRLRHEQGFNKQF